MKKVAITLLVFIFTPCAAIADEPTRCPPSYVYPGVMSNGKAGLKCYISTNGGKDCYTLTCAKGAKCARGCDTPSPRPGIDLLEQKTKPGPLPGPLPASIPVPIIKATPPAK